MVSIHTLLPQSPLEPLTKRLALGWSYQFPFLALQRLGGFLLQVQGQEIPELPFVSCHL